MAVSKMRSTGQLVVYWGTYDEILRTPTEKNSFYFSYDTGEFFVGDGVKKISFTGFRDKGRLALAVREAFNEYSADLGETVEEVFNSSVKTIIDVENPVAVLKNALYSDGVYMAVNGSSYEMYRKNGMEITKLEEK